LRGIGPVTAKYLPELTRFDRRSTRQSAAQVV
jgi:hypothetical protein